MKKQIVKIVLGVVVILGAATTSFAQKGYLTGRYAPVMSGTDAGCDAFHVYCSGSTTSR
jgi:hypothetical protein